MAPKRRQATLKDLLRNFQRFFFLPLEHLLASHKDVNTLTNAFKSGYPSSWDRQAVSRLMSELMMACNENKQILLELDDDGQVVPAEGQPNGVPPAEYLEVFLTAVRTRARFLQPVSNEILWEFLNVICDGKLAWISVMNVERTEEDKGWPLRVVEFLPTYQIWLLLHPPCGHVSNLGCHDDGFLLGKAGTYNAQAGQGFVMGHRYKRLPSITDAHMLWGIPQGLQELVKDRLAARGYHDARATLFGCWMREKFGMQYGI